MSDAGGLPDDEVTPQDSVSQASGATTTASKACLRAASKRARQEAEMAFLKKKMDLELSMAEMEADAKVEEAELAQRKAERDRRRRRAEISLHQINAFSELEATRAQEQVLGEMIHDNRSAVSRIKWKAHPPSDDSGRSLTLHNALEQTRFPVIADDDDQGRATTVKLNLRPSIMTGTNFDQMVSPLVTTTASQHPAFFDYRDNLFTDAAPTPDTGQFASTSLPNRVTSQPTLLPISPVIPTTNLAAMLSSTTRPTTTESQEIIMKGNLSQPAVSYTTTTTNIHTAVSAAPMYRNYGDANNFVPQQGYQLPVDTCLQINTGYAPTQTIQAHRLHHFWNV